MVGVGEQGASLINRDAREIMFQPLHPETGAPLHGECVNAVQQGLDVQ